MEEITGARKMANGVLVEYRRGGVSQMVGFTYEDLIAMEINVLDLVENPRDYEVDPEGKAIFANPAKCEQPPAG
ncbi:hypothetical protein [Methanofollis sp. UBA420]|jgi:hypothetical protein|uniref:hypothetical protein n=1 Tax=Methanofollis sp. UBA420 TaxID=1915514 RepID=UPI00316AE94D